jgi:hypothetical protein
VTAQVLADAEYARSLVSQAVSTKGATVSTTLVIVPCGQRKVWDRYPDRGPTAACNAYTGAPFKLNRAYGEQFGDRWVILSAKYGFVAPTFLIPGGYNVTFKQKVTNPVSFDVLTEQIAEQRLNDFTRIVGLGGKAYRHVIEKAFDRFASPVVFPFSGLPIGLAMQATKRTILTKSEPATRMS